jgi:hypothetical protein
LLARARARERERFMGGCSATDVAVCARDHDRGTIADNPLPATPEEAGHGLSSDLLAISAEKELAP